MKKLPIAFIFIWLFICMSATAESCEHPESFECGNGQYQCLETFTEEHHVYTYYTLMSCLDCKEVFSVPVSEPGWGPSSLPHIFSIKVSLGLTGATTHTYRYNCSRSTSCPHYRLETHNSMTVSDLGHETSTIHVYLYTCTEPDCTFSITVRNNCDSNCPIGIYKRKPNIETQ